LLEHGKLYTCSREMGRGGRRLVLVCSSSSRRRRKMIGILAVTRPLFGVNINE